MILFITRKYPPSVGGMQRQSFELTTSIKKLAEAYIISWGNSQVFLPLFLLSAFFRGCCVFLTKNIELIHLGDALLSPLGYVLRSIFKIPVVATVHGRDIVFPFKLYQMVVPWFLKRLDKIICISEQTREQVLTRAIPLEKTVVITNGISIENHRFGIRSNFHIDSVEKIINQSLDGKTVLLTVGRLVKRKGVNYFIRQVFPRVLETETKVIYFIVGKGPYRSVIEQSVRELNLQDRVFFFGQVDKELLDTVYAVADIFVMPNIPVEGDMEGFGLVALEANLAGLPVVASDLEGIKDAISHGENGCLIEYNNTEKFVSTISDLIRDPSRRKKFGKKAREFVISHYSWYRIGVQYLKEFESLMNG